MNTKLRIGLVLSALVVVPWIVVAAPSVNAATKKIAEVTAGNALGGDRMGSSVAIGDGTMVVGAPYAASLGPASGAAYIFPQDAATGVWGPGYPVSASNGKSFDYFGWSAAVGNQLVAVGAIRGDSPNTKYTGAVYLFSRVDDGTQTGRWVENSMVTADDGKQYDYFGYSLAISGDVLVVGARNGDSDLNRKDTGAVYVFRVTYDQETGKWTCEPKAKLTASDTVTGDQFGASVATDGEIIVVGAPNGTGDGTLKNTGAVYLFQREYNLSTPTWTWSLARKVTADDSPTGSRFGAAVAIDGENLAVGAPGKVCNLPGDSQCDVGAVYLFAKDGGLWTEKTKLAGAPAQGGDQFGAALSVSSPLLVVGVPYGPIADGTTSGYVYALRYDENTKAWKPPLRPKLVDENATANEEFGFAVALKDNRVVVGAPDAGQTGSVSEFTINEPPIVTSATANPPEVHEGETVNLSGSASDPDEGDFLTYRWVQVGLGGLDPVSIVQPDPNKPQATFVAPPVPASAADSPELIFELTAVDDSNDASDPVTVSVVVTKPQCQVTSQFGQKRSWILDRDTFTFQGNKGDTIALTLQPAQDGTANGGRAVLILQDKIRGTWFFRANRGALSDQVKIQATLPAAGEYLVTVMDDPFCRRSARFRGEYVLSLEGVSGCLEQTQRSIAVKKKVEPPANSCDRDERLTEGFWF
jgi:FG-GAP repeat/K319L-like, PKD domain